MTEREAQRLLDAIRTPEAKAAMSPATRAKYGLPPANALPHVDVGRTRYQLLRSGKIWIFTRIGKGQRWRLEPGEIEPKAEWLPRDVRTMVDEAVCEGRVEC